MLTLAAILIGFIRDMCLDVSGNMVDRKKCNFESFGYVEGVGGWDHLLQKHCSIDKSRWHELCYINILTHTYILLPPRQWTDLQVMQSVSYSFDILVPWQLNLACIFNIKVDMIKWNYWYWWLKCGEQTRYPFWSGWTSMTSGCPEVSTRIFLISLSLSWAHGVSLFS